MTSSWRDITFTSSTCIKIPPSNIVIKDNLAVCTSDEPHITFSRIVIEKKTGQVLRHASAGFYLEGRSLSGQSRSMWNLTIKSDSYESVLGLAYSVAAVSGADNIPDDWPEEVRELIQEMAEIRNDCALPIIPLASQDPAHIRYIQSLLDELHDQTPGRLISSFRNANNKPITEWDYLKEASYRTESLPQSPIQYCFPSLEIAAIKLCTGRYLEHRWQESVMAGLSGGTDVTFVVVGVGLVLAFVRYQDRKQIKKKAQLDDHMTIQIIIEVDDSSEEEDDDGIRMKKFVKAKGRLASNRLGVESDFSILLERPHKDIFRVASKYGEQLAFMPAEVKIEDNERLAQLEVKAVHTLCQEGDNPIHSFKRCCLLKTQRVHLQRVSCWMMWAAHHQRFALLFKLFFKS